MTNILFKKLSKTDFPLLLQWLEKPHVKMWWDKDIAWTAALIREKYTSYVEGYKNENGKNRRIYAYIIQSNDVPIGYIQYYDIQDFANEYKNTIKDIVKKCALFDWYIGEETYLGKGLGTKILACFLEEYIFKDFDNCCVVSEKMNTKALRVYEKCEFIFVSELSGHILLMKRKNTEKWVEQQ